MTSTHTDPAPLLTTPPCADPPHSTRLRGRFPLLLCEKCGQSRLERRSRHGLIAVVFSLAGFFPHKCRKCNAKQYRLIGPFRLALAVLSTVASLAVVVNSSGVIRRLRPEPRALSSVAPASEDALFASQLASGRVGAFEKLLAARRKQFLHNEDIALLLQSGIEREVVLKLIKASNPAFDISPAGILELRKAGADNAVILAIIDRITADVAASR